MVETNASDMAVAAVLMQHDQPVVFMSKALKSAQYNYHTTNNKQLAIVLACKRWCYFLDGKKAVDKSKTYYKNPHSTQFEQKISQVVWNSSW